MQPGFPRVAAADVTLQIAPVPHVPLNNPAEGGVAQTTRGLSTVLCAGGSPVHSVVRSAANAAIHVAFCDNDNEAMREIYRLRPSVVVIEIGGTALRKPTRLVRLAKGERPNTYVIGYCSFSARAGDDLVLAAQAGLDTIVFEGGTDARRTLRNQIAEHADGSPAAGLLERLKLALHPLAVPVPEHVLAHAATAPNVNDVAHALGCTPRTLARRFAKAGLPAPDALITQLRWSRIADLLARRRLSSTEVARISGFSNTRAMRSALKRRFGAGLAQLSDTETAEQLRELLLRAYGRVRE
jgi:AraC-like DNA-binding protein